MNSKIFREYNIRGNYPLDINEDVAYKIGKSFGSYIKKMNKNKALIGYDNRLSSPSLASNLINGILDTGVDVVSLGLVTTPMYYYGRVLLNIWSGIMITASHNPATDNGFKISFTNIGNAAGSEIYEFRDFTFKEEFIDGKGTLSTYDIKEDYINLVKNSLKFDKKIKVVVDLGNGTGSIIIKDVLNNLPIEYELLFEENDGTFPNHHPDPAVASNLVDLQKKVVELNYDLGFAIDADGDRVRVVDNKGNIIDTDIYMAIMYRYLYPNLKTKAALYDVKCSKSLIDEVERLGLKPIMNRTGNSYQYRKVAETNVDFGGEYSGHLFFNDRYPGIDDGIYAGLRMCEVVSNQDKTMYELTKGFNTYYKTDELKIQVTDENKFQIIEELKKYLNLKQYQYNDIDGVRVIFDDGWGLVRCSNTGPNLTLRFEANKESRLEEIKNELMEEVNRIIKDVLK